MTATSSIQSARRVRASQRKGETSCFVWKAVRPHRKNLIFFGLLNANGSPSCYMPLKALSPTPLYYPLRFSATKHHFIALRSSAMQLSPARRLGSVVRG